MQKTTKRLLITCVILTVLVLVGVVTYSMRTTSPHGIMVLEWTDSDSGCIFQVYERPGAIVHNFSTLLVRCEEEERFVTIDDDMMLRTVQFVRFSEWLLVLNEQYVVAGYNFQDKSLVGEHGGARLPFTNHGKAGIIVASTDKKIAGDAGLIPLRFPMIPKPQTD